MAVSKILKEDEKFFLEIFGLKCVSDHSESIPEKKISNFFRFLDPRKWAHNDQKWAKTPKTARKIFFSYFFFLYLHFPQLWGHFAPSRTTLAFKIRHICQNSTFPIWPRIENWPKMGRKNFFGSKFFFIVSADLFVIF